MSGSCGRKKGNKLRINVLASIPFQSQDTEITMLLAIHPPIHDGVVVKKKKTRLSPWPQDVVESFIWFLDKLSVHEEFLY